MSVHETLTDLVDLYALDALTGSELRSFESHLDVCETCCHDVDFAHSITASLVPDSDPPQGVWERIIAELEPPNVVQMIRPRPRSRFWMTMGSIAAVLAFFIAGLLVSGKSVDPTGADALTAAANAAAAGDDATDVLLEAGGVAVARVVLTADGHGYVLPTGQLPDLRPDRTYQLWVINDQELVISAGVLGPNPEPSTFTWSGGVAGVALTREAAGGVEVSEGDLVAAVTDL